MDEIKNVKAREILDSRGNPTVEAIVKTGKASASAAVPSGASTGENEALELRDKGERYHGKGVLKAVENINNIIAPELNGMSVLDQSKIDKRMLDIDGTDDKSNIGANAILAVSLASARTASKVLDIPLYRYLGRTNDDLLPAPFMNVLNGGEHAGNELDIQEYMLVPVGADTFKEALRMGTEVYHVLEDIIEKKYGPSATSIGDEGGYAPPLEDPIEPFELLSEAIQETGYGEKIKLAIDSAASEFKTKDGYDFSGEKLSLDEMVDFYDRLVEEFPIISIEDPLAEDDWSGFSTLTDRLGHKTQIIGDDLFVSNPEIIRKGIREEVCNCVLLKVNQIGSLTEAMEAASIAKRNDYGLQVSHRSGETCDPFIADLSVALSSGQIKAGAPSRGERTAKYNRLLQIEDELEDVARYSGAENESHH